MLDAFKLTNGKIYAVPPENFPPHVVIVDDILYLIHSYGVPIFDIQDKRFLPVKESYVSVLAYRREDARQATQTIDHLSALLDKGGCARMSQQR